MRYRLQRKERVALPNVLGNHSMPVHTYRWKDIVASDDYEALFAMMPKDDAKYRIEDTRQGLQDEPAEQMGPSLSAN